MFHGQTGPVSSNAGAGLSSLTETTKSSSAWHPPQNNLRGSRFRTSQDEDSRTPPCIDDDLMESDGMGCRTRDLPPPIRDNESMGLRVQDQAMTDCGEWGSRSVDIACESGGAVHESRTKAKLSAARSARIKKTKAAPTKRVRHYDRSKDEGWPPEGYAVHWGASGPRYWGTSPIPDYIPDEEVWKYLVETYKVRGTVDVCLWPDCGRQGKAGMNVRRHIESSHLGLKLARSGAGGDSDRSR
ncbi:hypothetical protein C8Q76DRAFT_698743 [Earliella scabrosa]|nr:hypothetical protein C8Q76DRAFT_698743 [Earliella scabrosa]